jgi:8-oxo-dGTP pyrophosphatase MutT (NUDIX family)
MAPIIIKVYCPADETYLVVREGSYEILDLSKPIDFLRNQIQSNKYLGSLRFCLNNYKGPVDPVDPVSMKNYIQGYIDSKYNSHIHRVMVRGSTILLRYPGSTWGFVKGSANEDDEGCTKKTAIREFYEEMGTIIPDEELVADATNTTNEVFQWTINEEKRDEIMLTFYEKGYHQSSEIYNPIFVTKEEILEADSAMFELNPVRQGFKDGFIIEEFKERYNAVRMNTVSYNLMGLPPRKTRTSIVTSEV